MDVAIPLKSVNRPICNAGIPIITELIYFLTCVGYQHLFNMYKTQRNITADKREGIT